MPCTSQLPATRAGIAEAIEIVGAEVVRLWEQAADVAAAGFPPETADGARRSALLPGGWRPGDAYVDQGPPK